MLFAYRRGTHPLVLCGVEIGAAAHDAADPLILVDQALWFMGRRQNARRMKKKYVNEGHKNDGTTEMGAKVNQRIGVIVFFVKNSDEAKEIKREEQVIEKRVDTIPGAMCVCGLPLTLPHVPLEIRRKGGLETCGA